MSGKKNKPKTVVTPTAIVKKPGPGKKGIVKNGNASTPSDDPPVQQRSIFGDWTGKTPVSLLHEQCQKNNWEKPEFEIKKRNNGFLGIVTLSMRNKKTAQMQTVTFSPPEDLVLPTSIEAKHVAATYALHRFKSDIPLYRVMPPEHRDYWKRFDMMKNQANAWEYDADPFNAHAPIKTEKKRRNVPTKEHASSAVPMPAPRQDQAKEPAMSEEMRKRWENLPAVQMGSDNRELVERVVKKSTIAYQPVSFIKTYKHKTNL